LSRVYLSCVCVFSTFLLFFLGLSLEGKMQITPVLDRVLPACRVRVGAPSTNTNPPSSSDPPPPEFSQVAALSQRRSEQQQQQQLQQANSTTAAHAKAAPALSPGLSSTHSRGSGGGASPVREGGEGPGGAAGLEVSDAFEELQAFFGGGTPADGPTASSSGKVGGLDPPNEPPVLSRRRGDVLLYCVCLLLLLCQV